MPKTAKKDNSVEDEGVIIAGDDGDMVVDLSGVSPDAGFEVIPRGRYPFIVDVVTYGTSSKGNPMWSWTLEVEGGDYAGRKQFYHSTFIPKMAARLKRDLITLGLDDLANNPFDPQEVADTGQLVGVRGVMRLGIGKYEGEDTNSVKGIYAADSSADAGGADEFA